MRTIRTKVYSFNELSKEAQQTVLTKMTDINIDYEWWDCIYTDAESIGLKITEFDIDYASYLKAELINDHIYTADKIKENHGTDCGTYQLATIYLTERDTVINTWPKDEGGQFEYVGDLDDKLDQLESDFVKGICNEYLFLLKLEYGYRTSYEAIKETIIANEYEFTIDGKQF